MDSFFRIGNWTNPSFIYITKGGVYMEMPVSIEQKKVIAELLADIIYEQMLKDANEKNGDASNDE